MGGQHLLRPGGADGRAGPPDHVGVADWTTRRGEKEKGWSGVYGLPRSLWLGDDGTLRLQPVKELETLRCHEKSWSDLALADGDAKALEGVTGDSCELALEIEPGAAERCGLKVRASAGGEEETLLYYDARKAELVFDSTRSGADGRKVVERAPFALQPGEPLKLRVFVDKSVVEIFANDRQAIGRRVYPAARRQPGRGPVRHGRQRPRSSPCGPGR